MSGKKNNTSLKIAKWLSVISMGTSFAAEMERGGGRENERREWALENPSSSSDKSTHRKTKTSQTLGSPLLPNKHHDPLILPFAVCPVMREGEKGKRRMMAILLPPEIGQWGCIAYVHVLSAHCHISGQKTFCFAQRGEGEKGTILVPLTVATGTMEKKK